MRQLPFRRAAALLLAAALLTAPALSAGMGAFLPQGPYAPFPDLVPDAWYFDAVCTVRTLGIMEGKPGGVFDPNGPLTLAEAATMAAKVRSLYAGGGFTPGGTPWYRSAVDYGVAQGFLTRGEFADYAAPATRADMAGMFAFALPTAEYGRQNRVVSLPDVNTETKYCDEIYLLYSAGVLTGDETGAFHPNDGITRAEAAAIISRAALPQRRRTLHLSTMAGGTAVAAYDGASFRVTLPADWTCLPDPGDGLTQLLAQSADGMSNVLICRYAKSDLPGGDVGTAARSFLDAQAAQPGYLLTSPPAGALFRGLSGCAFSFALDGVPYRGWCVENGAAYFMLLLGGRETGLELLYTLDLSL